MNEKLFWGLRSAFKDSYSAKDFISDLQAGAIVGIVALPLAMALAVASGVAPQNGLYTVIIGGALVALFGGSRFQVSGPTAAFVVLLLPVVQQHGLSGLFVAGIISGLLCILYGLLGLGDIIQFVPHSVTTGFTTGIALVIATLQINDLLGLHIDTLSPDFLHRLAQVVTSLGDLNFSEASTGLTTLGLIIFASKRVKKIPAPIFALTIVTLGIVILKKWAADVDVATIASRFKYSSGGEIFNGIPTGLPHLAWPWTAQMAGDQGFALNWTHLREIFPSAFAISLLGAIESLLSAVVADGMTMSRHNPNAELIGLGLANVICPFFGGIPATGAIARTTTNIRFGARSPIAAIVHSLVVLIVLVSLAPYVSLIPMAALAALLLFVAWNMAERHNFANILRIGTRDDRLVLVVGFGLTVLFDMTIGVAGGVLLSSALFIRQMALATQGEIHTFETHKGVVPGLKSDVIYYRIRGNLFFGGAQRALERFSSFSMPVKKVIFDLTDVDFIDITGLVAFDSALHRSQKMGLSVSIICPRREIQLQLKKLRSLKPSGGKEIEILDRLEGE